MLFRIIILVAIIFLIVTAVQRVVMGYYRKRLLNIVEDRFAGRRIILMALSANYFGRKSAGVKQIRGNGALVLTEDELWFCLAAPQREIGIPISAIQKVEITRSHLGKSIFRPLLAVSFAYQGSVEQIAWHISNPEKWESAIEDLRR